MITHITKLDKDASYVVQLKKATTEQINNISEIFKKAGIAVIIITYDDTPVKIDKK